MNEKDCHFFLVAFSLNWSNNSQVQSFIQGKSWDPCDSPSYSLRCWRPLWNKDLKKGKGLAVPTSDPLPQRSTSWVVIMDQGLAPPNGSIRLLPLVAHFADEETELERLNDFTRFLQLVCGRAWAWIQEIWAPSWDSSCGLSSGVLPGCLIWTQRC